MALIKCPECSREISDIAEVCPQCGFPITKYLEKKKAGQLEQEAIADEKRNSNKSYLSPETKLLYDNYKTNNSKPPDSSQVWLSLIISAIVGWVFYFTTSSTVVGIVTLIICLCAAFRAVFLANNSKSQKSTFDKVMFSWKGVVGYITLIALIIVPQNIYLSHAENKRKEKALQTILDESKKIYAQKKIEFKSAKTLIKDNKLLDNDLLKIKANLQYFDASMPEYKEAQELLPTVIKKIAAYEKVLEAKASKERKAAEDALYTPGGKRVHARHPNWSPDDCNIVAKGHIYVGMSAEQVAASWGRPYRINKTHGSYGTHEQWVMNEYGNNYVYFEDGICTSFQN